MDFELNDEMRMMSDMTRDFAREQIEPIAAELDEHHRFPEQIVAKMAELGLLGIPYPEQYGGAGMNYQCYAIAVEEISKACAGTGVILSAHTSLGSDPIYKYGTEEQKQKFLTQLAQGKKIGCFGLTEPGAGSDAAALKTTAVPTDNGWVLNGTKNFITNAVQAGIAIVFAQTDKEKGYKGLAAFIVEKDTPGLTVGKVEDKMGIRASSTAELVFEDCEIPKENLLGEVGKGFRIALSTLDGGRIGIASQAVGIASAALEKATAYAKERVQFGKPIAKLQAIQWMLADMATEIDAARLLVRRAAWLKDQGKNYISEASMAKLFAAETAMRATNKAIQVHGGYGYCKEYPVERYYRDAKITEIYEGTSEVQRLVIAANLLKD
ncbi:MAG: acyl-CoA dehydrogenase [Candidatus Alcyoniella australis]|nr:acyl-CoA dehydrogenase [Candidatus Alcyoniella australis]